MNCDSDPPKGFGGAGENRTHDRGFADLGLTTWLPRQIVSLNDTLRLARQKKKPPLGQGFKKLERETGFEPATSTLARSHSTTELLPPNFVSINDRVPGEQTCEFRTA